MRALIGGGALLTVKNSEAMDVPRYYFDAPLQTANALAFGLQQSGQIGAEPLVEHFFAGTNLFTYMSSSGFNQAAPEIIRRSLQVYPTSLSELKLISDEVAQTFGAWYHPNLMDQGQLPTAEELMAAVGSNMAYLQNKWGDSVLALMNSMGTPASLKHRVQVLDQHARFKQAIASDLGTNLHLYQVADEPGLSTLNTAAGNITQGGVAIAGLGVAVKIFGAGATAVEASATALTIIGGGLIFLGVALSFYAAYESIQAIQNRVAPLQPGDGQGLGDLPCYHEIPPCPISNQ